jgi:translation initiation factor IF-1
MSRTPSRPTTRPAAARRTASKPPHRSTDTSPESQTIRTKGTVKLVSRDATFLVETDQGLEVIARAAGRMSRGRKIRILAGDTVDIEVSLYDLTKGRIVWRYV